MTALVALAASSSAAEGLWTAPSEAGRNSNPVVASPASLKKGRTLYENRCADCHGNKGRGDGSGGSDLERRPTDLTAGAVTRQSDGALEWKIAEGRRPMPAYRRKLSEEERWHVINYIRSLPPKTKQTPAAKAPADNNNKNKNQ